MVLENGFGSCCKTDRWDWMWSLRKSVYGVEHRKIEGKGQNHGIHQHLTLAGRGVQKNCWVVKRTRWRTKKEGKNLEREVTIWYIKKGLVKTLQSLPDFAVRHQLLTSKRVLRDRRQIPVGWGMSGMKWRH